MSLVIHRQLDIAEPAVRVGRAEPSSQSACGRVGRPANPTGVLLVDAAAGTRDPFDSDDHARRGACEWLRPRLGGDAADSPSAAGDLIDWLYDIARCHAARARVSVGDRADVVQEAVTDAYRAVARDGERFRGADNPAALLETVIGRAVGLAHHRARMAGFGGLATNGRHWRAIAPQLVGGPVADDFLVDVPVQACQPTRHVPDAAARINDWVAAELGITLTSDALHALEYVLDRLVAGVSRRSLRRGGHSALSRDPAMRHLGFTPATAQLFARWALGSEKSDVPPAVIDAAIAHLVTDPGCAVTLRSKALAGGFATEPATIRRAS